MKKLKFILLIVFDIISIIIAERSIIEINGVIAYFIFALPFVVNILFLWKNHIKFFNQLIISLLIFVYLITGAVFLIRTDSQKLLRQNKDGRYTYATYEINPGAMGHISYADKVYYNLIDTNFLTVRIVKSTKHYRYIG